jgi:hypothetical protein
LSNRVWYPALSGAGAALSHTSDDIKGADFPPVNAMNAGWRKIGRIPSLSIAK